MSMDYCEHPECRTWERCRFTNDLLGGASKVDPTTTDELVFNVKSWLDAAYPDDPGAAQETPDPQPQQEDSDVIEKIPESTHQDDALDTLVSQASIPNLGALIKQGIKQGLIAPTATYC